MSIFMLMVHVDHKKIVPLQTNFPCKICVVQYFMGQCLFFLLIASNDVIRIVDDCAFQAIVVFIRYGRGKKYI